MWMSLGRDGKGDKNVDSLAAGKSAMPHVGFD